MNPCEIGFDCPYEGQSDEGNRLCLHPCLKGYCPDTEVVDCPVVENGTGMRILLNVYGVVIFGDERDARHACERMIREIRGMEEKTYRISIGSVGPFNCRAASPREAIEATVPNPDEVAIIWYTDWRGGLYRVGYYDGNGPGAAFIGKIAVVKEESA